MFVLRVADNFHYMDQDETYTHSEYATWADAVAVARRIVDESLAEHYRPGISAGELFSMYTSFGDDPFIVSPPPGERFSAWDYARQQCELLCASGARLATDPLPGQATADPPPHE